MQPTTEQVEQVKENLCKAMGYRLYRHLCPSDKEIYSLLEMDFPPAQATRIILAELECR